MLLVFISYFHLEQTIRWSALLTCWLGCPTVYDDNKTETYNYSKYVMVVSIYILTHEVSCGLSSRCESLYPLDGLFNSAFILKVHPAAWCTD